MLRGYARRHHKRAEERESGDDQRQTLLRTLRVRHHDRRGVTTLAHRGQRVPVHEQRLAERRGLKGCVAGRHVHVPGRGGGVRGTDAAAGRGVRPRLRRREVDANGGVGRVAHAAGRG